MYITSTGMVSPVGLSAEASCVAMYAGIAAFEELPYVDNRGEPIIGAVVPSISFEMKRDERLLLMLEQAVAECISKCGNLRFNQVPLFVCLAEEGRPGSGASLSPIIISQIENRLDTQFHPLYSKVICSGHTSGFKGMDYAKILMNEHGICQCLVCGVDSYINVSSLLWLDQDFRLKTDDNSDGVVPGEAACAVMVEKSVSSDFDSRSAFIRGIGLSGEEATILNDVPLMAQGMSSAIRSALKEAELEMHEIDLRLADVTGEAYCFKEQLLSKMKLQRKDANIFVDFWHHAENIGDVGSAGGLVQLLLAKETVSRKMNHIHYLLCTTSNVLTDRAAMVIHLN